MTTVLVRLYVTCPTICGMALGFVVVLIEQAT